MNCKNNNIVTVILSKAKNLNTATVDALRSFTPFRMTMLAAAMALSFSACQNEEPLDAPVAKDALALMPAETPVGIQAQLKGGFAQGESRTGTSTTATNWYAWCEIHPTNQLVGIELTVPGASDPDKTSLSANDVSLESLQTTEPFSTLMLKDFNLTEGGDRCVTRWTALWAYNRGFDNLIGFARLKADAQGNPVLDFGELQHANTKVTLVLQDEQGAPILVNDYNQISAELSLQDSGIIPIYTPEGQTQGVRFNRSFDGIKTLQADEAIDPACFGWTVYARNNIYTYSLYEMCNADDTASYYGEQNNILTAIVCPTPTHKDNNDNTYTLLEGGPQLTDDEKLTIEVKEDPDGNGPLTTGTYTLKLKDVKVTENGQQKPLTAMKSGEHLTLTVTLAHNMKVSATATIGGWEEVSADVDLNQDPSKLPPYEYDATTKTYTVYEEPYVKTVWGMKAADDKVMYDGMLVVDGSASTDAIYSVITGAIDDGITGFYVINISNEDKGQKLGTAIYYLVDVYEGGDPKNPNNPYIGTLSIVLADAEAIDDALYYCAALKSVSAPKVKSVGDWAFASSKFLTKVTLDAATTIGEMAFFDCPNLKELTFGGVITEIGEMAFATYGSSNEPWTLNCDLTLANGQKHMLEITPTNPISYPDVYPVTPADEDAEENRRIWADYTWKSITIKQ